MIKIGNVKNGFEKYKNPIYVGRRMGAYGAEPKYRASPLANPFRIGQDGNREEVIEKYRQWLRERVFTNTEINRELARMIKMELAGEEFTLMCWCHPEPCHAEVIKTAVEAFAARERAK